MMNKFFLGHMIVLGSPVLDVENRLSFFVEK